MNTLYIYEQFFTVAFLILNPAIEPNIAQYTYSNYTFSIVILLKLPPEKYIAYPYFN
jgi:hypothetical protein